MNLKNPERRMRFSFGKNWSSFSKSALTQAHVDAARVDFAKLLSADELAGKRFLDIGFGQGLSLFFASEAKAEAHGIDIDDQNILAFENTARFFSGVTRPTIQIGSILDAAFVEKLKVEGLFDVVHSWGVLHHTGNLAEALRQTFGLVKPGGLLVIALYKRHWSSPFWLFIKWLYNRLPSLGQRALISLLYLPLWLATKLIVKDGPGSKRRGMDFYHDVVDWVGGYPYEYISAEEVRELLKSQDFAELRFFPALVPTGNNEFVFKKLLKT